MANSITLVAPGYEYVCLGVWEEEGAAQELESVDVWPLLCSLPVS